MKLTQQSIIKCGMATLLSLTLVVSGCNMNWLATAISDIPVVLQIVTSVISVIDVAKGKGTISPGEAIPIENAAAQVKNDLVLLQAAVQQYKVAEASAKPGIQGKIDSLLTVVQTDLQAILSAAHISNPATLTAVTLSVQLAITTIMAIQSLIPLQPVAGGAKTARLAHPPMSAKQLKREQNRIVTSNGYPEAAIQ